jgi:prepilin-type N-terminal cleavage/methylation domain-containing protein
MLTRLKSQDGFTLPEMLVSMVLMLVIMGATLSTLDEGGTNRRLNDDRNDAVDQARTSIDTVVRQLRNLAAPSAATPDAITRAQATDFAFRTFDPNKRIVRYCLQTPTNSTTPVTTAANLYQMLSVNASVAASAFNDCNGSTSGWSSRRIVATNVINRRSGDTPRDIFAYNGNVANTATITNVRMQLSIDVNAGTKRPAPITLASGAALRNQNQAPTALFTVAKQGPRRFIMNATGSFDPEGHNLIYRWYADVSATFTPSSTNFLAAGPVLDWTFPTGQPAGSPSNFYIKLVVSDSNLTDTCPTSAGATTNCSTAGPLTW